MKIIENRFMYMDDLRNLCIKENWFTHADCEEYDHFLNMIYDSNGKRRNVTKNLLYKMACEVEKYSEMDGILDTGTIMFLLCGICKSHFEIED